MPKRRDASKKPYSKDDLEQALEAIKNGMAIKKASRDFGIPRGTLQNRVHGRTKKSVNCSGPSPFFSEEEELYIVNWINECARKGFPKRPDDLLYVVKEFLDVTGKENPFNGTFAFQPLSQFSCL